MGTKHGVDEGRWYTAPELSEASGLPEKRVRAGLASGDLKASTFGAPHRPRIQGRDFLAWAEATTVRPRPPEPDVSERARRILAERFPDLAERLEGGDDGRA